MRAHIHPLLREGFILLLSTPDLISPPMGYFVSPWSESESHAIRIVGVVVVPVTVRIDVPEVVAVVRRAQPPVRGSIAE